MVKFESKLPVVVVSGSDVVVLGIARSLGKYKIPVIVISWHKRPLVSYSRYISELVYTSDPVKDENKFISDLCSFGNGIYKKYNKRILIFPSEDAGLLLLAKYYDKIRQYFVILGDSNEIGLWKFIRKDLFFNEIKELDIPIPKTMGCSEIKDIAKVANNMSYPCIIKPSEKDMTLSFFHTYKAKIVIAKSKKDLQKNLHDMISSGKKVIVQEFIYAPIGDEFCWWGYRSRNGNAMEGITAQEVRKLPQHGGTATFMITREIPEIQEYAPKILNKINFWGVAEIAFKKDENDGNYKIIEMNPRCWLQCYLATAAGLDLPCIVYNEVYNNKVYVPRIEVIKEIKWINLESDFVRAILKNEENKFLKSVFKWLKDLHGEKVYAILDLHDLRLLLRWFLMLLSIILKAVIKKFIKRN